MFALKACAAKREEGVLGRAEFFTVAIVGGKCGGCGVFNRYAITEEDRELIRNELIQIGRASCRERV